MRRRRRARRGCDKTERSERAVSDTVAERYPMMEEWRESGRGGEGEEGGSIGLVGWRFIYNAERPGERVYLCGQDLRRGLQFVSVCVCVCVSIRIIVYTLYQ